MCVYCINMHMTCIFIFKMIFCFIFPEKFPSLVLSGKIMEILKCIHIHIIHIIYTYFTCVNTDEGSSSVGGYRSDRRRSGYAASGRGRSPYSPYGRSGGRGGGGRSYASAYEDEQFAHEFLSQFGYIPKETANSTRSNSVSLETSIENFQRVAGIPQTGYLDKTTKAWMKRPRYRFDF